MILAIEIPAMMAVMINPGMPSQLLYTPIYYWE